MKMPPSAPVLELKNLTVVCGKENKKRLLHLGLKKRNKETL